MVKKNMKWILIALGVLALAAKNMKWILIALGVLALAAGTYGVLTDATPPVLEEVQGG